jgi:hypothetical protein
MGRIWDESGCHERAKRPSKSPGKPGALLSAGGSTVEDAEPATRAVSGNPLKLRELFGLLDEFSPDFEIVEPKKAAVE